MKHCSILSVWSVQLLLYHQDPREGRVANKLSWNNLLCAVIPLRNYSLTDSQLSIVHKVHIGHMNAALRHLLIAAQPLLTSSGPRSGCILTCTEVHLLENLLFTIVWRLCRSKSLLQRHCSFRVSLWMCWIVVGQQTALQITWRKWLCERPLPALGMEIQIFL